MKTGGGDFSAEAYEQMRNAYDKEQQRQVDDEVKGTQLMGMEYGLETMPVDSPWKDKIENWTYPTGKGQYLDEKQSPDEVLQVMRDAAQARIDARNDEAAEEEVDEEEDEVLDDEDLNIAKMTEEEFEAYINSILEEVEDEDEETQDEEEDDEADEEETQEEEEDEDEDAPEANDEGDDTEADAETEEDEDEGGNESEEDDYDPEDIAAQIAELRAEIEDMQFVPTQEDDES